MRIARSILNNEGSNTEEHLLFYDLKMMRGYFCEWGIAEWYGYYIKIVQKVQEQLLLAYNTVDDYVAYKKGWYQTMKEVKTVGIHYIPGERLLTQRHKKSERPHYRKNGAFVNPTGFGYATETKPSMLILTFDTGEGMAQVRID